MDYLSGRQAKDFLERVSSGTIRRFEWIFRQFKEETRRLSSAKSRVDDDEMAERRPKLRTPEFLRHTLVTFRMYQMNFDGNAERVYSGYWDTAKVRFVEAGV